MVFSSTPITAEFKYSPLDSKPRTLRLIKLRPLVPSLFPLFEETLHVEVIEGSLDDIGPYDALSYTWGDVGRAPPDRPVIVETPTGKRVMKIYRSLEVALLSLAKASDQHRRPLFIDQMCINQEDEDEKAVQVALMGDIYSSCARVVVWLGPGTRRSDEFFGFTSEISCEGVLGRVMGPNVGHFPQVFSAVVDPDADVGSSEAVRQDRDDVLRLVRRYGPRYPLHGVADVLERAWFNRLWVIQEVCLPQNAVFVCGSRSLCFDCFRAGILFYSIWNKADSYWLHNLKPKASKREMSLRNRIFTLNNAFVRFFQQRKAIHLNGAKMSLYDLVLKHSVNGAGIKIGAKLGEDRIYGLLGLAGDDEIKRNTEVVYNGLRNVYTRFAAVVARQNLDVLLFSQKAGTETELPSWVPDWSSAHLEIPCAYSDLATPIFSAGGNTADQPPIVDVLQGSLVVHGYLVDRIDRVGVCGIQESPGENPVEQVDYPSVTRFFDEIHEYLELAGGIEGAPFQYSSHQTLHDVAALRLADGGLSHRQFPSIFDPATAQATLERIHHNIRRTGQVLIDSEERAQSYTITRIIRTIGIVPWYWVPASEVEVLRLCAADPVGAARRWAGGVFDFATDMAAIVLASTAVQLTAWFVRVRRRYLTRVDLGATDHARVYERVGLDPTLPHTRQWEHYTSNLYKTIGRRLFLTARGYVGLGPTHMDKGDVVVVLGGSSAPHVLRPCGDVQIIPEGDGTVLSSQENTSGEIGSVGANANWSYVGEAYCEGIMDGEVPRERGSADASQFRIL